MIKLVFKLCLVCTVAATLQSAEHVVAQEKQAKEEEIVLHTLPPNEPLSTLIKQFSPKIAEIIAGYHDQGVEGEVVPILNMQDYLFQRTSDSDEMVIFGANEDLLFPSIQYAKLAKCNTCNQGGTCIYSRSFRHWNTEALKWQLTGCRPPTHEGSSHIHYISPSSISQIPLQAVPSLCYGAISMLEQLSSFEVDLRQQNDPVVEAGRVISTMATMPGMDMYHLVQLWKNTVLHLQKLSSSYPDNQFPEQPIENYTTEMEATTIEVLSRSKKQIANSEVRRLNRILELYKKHESWIDKFLKGKSDMVPIFYKGTTAEECAQHAQTRRKEGYKCTTIPPQSSTDWKITMPGKLIEGPTWAFLHHNG